MKLAKYLLAWTCFSSQFVHAAQLEACGKITKLEGDTCTNLDVKLDLSDCDENGLGLVIPQIKCSANKAVAIYRTPRANYRAILQPKDSGWGKKEFELKGKIWRHKKETPVAATVVPMESPVRTVAADSQSSAPTPLATGKRISDEEIANVVNLFSGFSFKGSVDAYYAYNANTPNVTTATPTASAPQTQNKYHVFDAYHDDFQLSYARLQVQKVTGPVTTTLDLGYGPTMQAVSGTKTDAGQFNVKQAIIGYKPYEKLNIEAGRFATYLGYEVIESQDNWNYSRGLLFGYFVPFWHQGVKATYNVTDSLSVMAMAADGWNNSYVDKRQKTYGAQVIWAATSDLSLYLNVITGMDAVPTNLRADAPKEKRTVYDFITTYKATNNLSFALNADVYNFSSFTAWGVAGYAKYQFNDKWSISPRYEYVDDKDNLALAETLPEGQKLSSYTLTLEQKITPNLSMKLEGRWDKSTSEIFQKGNGTFTSGQMLGILGLVASF